MDGRGREGLSGTIYLLAMFTDLRIARGLNFSLV